MSSVQRGFAPRGMVIRSAITPKVFTAKLDGQPAFPILTTYSNGVLGIANFNPAWKLTPVPPAPPLCWYFEQDNVQAAIKQGGQHNITGLTRQFYDIVGKVLFNDWNWIQNPVVKVNGVAQQIQLSTYSIDQICTTVTNGTSFYSDGYPVMYILTQPIIVEYINPSGDTMTVEILNSLEGCCGNNDNELPDGQCYSDYLFWNDNINNCGIGGWQVGSSQVHIGCDAGLTSQGVFAVAVGYAAGETSQGADTVAVGNEAGNLNQGECAVAIGFQAGWSNQGSNTVAVGCMAGYDPQQPLATAIGYQAGAYNQQESAVAIGTNAGYEQQQQRAVAVGDYAGSTSQGRFSVAVGVGAGQTSQSESAVAIGNNAGNTGQRSNAVAVGFQAGKTNQQGSAVAIGNEAGLIRQSLAAVAIGTQAGQTSQQSNTVAIGTSAGKTSQSSAAVAIGDQAGQTNQFASAVAVGLSAGSTSQQSFATAIGAAAGQINQGQCAVAVGQSAGSNTQRSNAVAIGCEAGLTSQGSNAVAIGYQSGSNAQAPFSVALGYQAQAVENNQVMIRTAANRRINLASNGILINGGSNGEIHVYPNDVVITNIPAGTSNEILIYNPATSAVTYSSFSNFIPDGSCYSDYLYWDGSNSWAVGSSQVHIGCGAGESNQDSFAVALGYQAGQTSQGSNAIALGYQSGSNAQAPFSVAIGYQAQADENNEVMISTADNRLMNLTSNGILIKGGSNAEIHVYPNDVKITNVPYAVSNNILYYDDVTGQVTWGQCGGGGGCPLGTCYSDYMYWDPTIGTGSWRVGSSQVHLGCGAGETSQGLFAVALGYQAGQTSQGIDAVAVGSKAGRVDQTSNAVAVGVRAGESNQQSNAVAMGVQAGEIIQQTGAVAIGGFAGQNEQGECSVAVGFEAGVNIQGSNSVAIGCGAGFNLQGSNAVAIGYEAGSNAQATESIAIGYQAQADENNEVMIRTADNRRINLASNGILINGGSNGEIHVYPNDVVITNVPAGRSNDVLIYDPATSAVTYTSFTNFIPNGVCYSDYLFWNNASSSWQVGSSNVHLGCEAGLIGQRSNAIAIGLSAGKSNQRIDAVSMGIRAGEINQQQAALAIGYQAGQTSQDLYALAFGYQAGQSNQGNGSISIGFNSGNNNQQASAIAIGANGAGYTSQSTNAIAIGNSAGNTYQQESAIALGAAAGLTSQGNCSVGIGSNAANTNQGSNSIAIGCGAGFNLQGSNAVAIGYEAGSNAQGTESIAIGYQAQAAENNEVMIRTADNRRINLSSNGILINGGSNGEIRVYPNDVKITNIPVGTSNDILFYDPATGAITHSAAPSGTLPTGECYSEYLYWDVVSNSWLVGSSQVHIGCDAGSNAQGNFAVAIGYKAGETSQGECSVAIGFEAGSNTQGSNAVAIGCGAGSNNQKSNSVAIGFAAGQSNQGSNSVAIGYEAAFDPQQNFAVAVGYQAAKFNQGNYGIAMGAEAGLSEQKNNAVAIGFQAGSNAQDQYAVAIGELAGATSQAQYGVAIGYTAGRTSQFRNAVAIGDAAGQTSQGEFSVALGAGAGTTNQGQRAIAIGHNSGNSIGITTQADDSICIGQRTVADGVNSIAIGSNATTDENDEIMIRSADNRRINLASNGILINGGSNGELHIYPDNVVITGIRNATSNNILYYDDATKEVLYGAAPAGAACPLDCAPPPGYAYPENPQYGIRVRDWDNNTGNVTYPIDILNNNPTAGSITCIRMKDTTATQDARGVYIEDLSSTGGEVVAIDMFRLVQSGGQYLTAFKSDDLEAAGATTRGLWLNNLKNNGPGVGLPGAVCGVDMTQLRANGTGGNALGMLVNDVQAVAGDAFGMYVTDIEGRQAFGASFSNIYSNGGNNTGVGIEIENVWGDNSITTVNSRGITMNNIGKDPTTSTTVANLAEGISISNVAGLDQGAFGVRATNIDVTGSGQLVGVDIRFLNGDQGDVKGIYINNVQGDRIVYGEQIEGIRTTNIAQPVTGLEIKTVNGGGSTKGINVTDIGSDFGVNSGTGHGVRINNVVGDVNGGGNYQAYGIEVKGTRNGNSQREAYGGYFTRVGDTVTKSADAAGQLLRVADGNLGLAVQVVNSNPRTYISLDAGNYVVLTSNAPATVNVGDATIPPEDGHWFVITKDTSNTFTLTDPSGNPFNGISGTFTYDGPAYNKVYMFWSADRATWLTNIISSGGSLPNGNCYSDYAYWDNVSSAWQVGSSQVHIGCGAGQFDQGPFAVAVGYNAGQTSQQEETVAVGSGAGQTSQSRRALAIGFQAGFEFQKETAVAVGYEAGKTSQGIEAVGVGLDAGWSNQGTRAVAVGTGAGRDFQGDFAVAVGSAAGVTSQRWQSIAVGRAAGNIEQGSNCIAIGYEAGRYLQGTSGDGSYSIAMGYEAGWSNQYGSATAIGYQAGWSNQGSNAVAIGTSAGYSNQGSNAVAIGISAGYSNQGTNSISIGYLAGNTSQCDGSIILNASGVDLPSSNAGLFIDPIRQVNNSNVVLYNTTTKEVTYDLVSSFNLFSLAYGSFRNNGVVANAGNAFIPLPVAASPPPQIPAPVGMALNAGGVQITNLGIYRVTLRVHFQNIDVLGAAQQVLLGIQDNAAPLVAFGSTSKALIPPMVAPLAPPYGDVIGVMEVVYEEILQLQAGQTYTPIFAAGVGGLAAAGVISTLGNPIAGPPFEANTLLTIQRVA